jgi:site-specific recombinase XerD
MLIYQDFAQPEAKSPAKRSLVLVTNANPTTEEASQTSKLNQAIKLLQETITKVDGAYAPSTIRAYRVDFQDLIKFCSERNAQALPAQPQLVAEYISKLTNSGRSSASIRRAIAGIATIHKLNRFSDPTKDPDVILEMRRMHRQLGRASNQAQGVTVDLLTQMVLATEGNVRGLRDRALLLIAYDTLCRRSELTGLRIEDIKMSIQDGLEHMSILLRRSKTDQDSNGRILHISADARLALQKWIEALGQVEGPLFRGVDRGQKITKHLGSGQINRIFKRLAHLAHIDPKLIRNISGHSMRVGHAQDLVSAGASLPILMSRGRWTKTDTVMRYVEHLNYRCV